MINAAGMAQTALNIIAQMHELRRPRFIPSVGALSGVIEDVFWSSVDQYEGNPLKARIFFAPKPGSGIVVGTNIIRLTSPHPVSRDSIRQLSPAHAPDGGLIALEDPEGTPQIVAILGGFPAVRPPSPLWLSVESRGLGCLRVSVSSWSILEFTRGVIKELGGMALDRFAAESLLVKSGLFPTAPEDRAWCVASMIMDIGEGIERIGTGGALWILPVSTAMSGDLKGLGHSVGMNPDWQEPFKEMWERRTSTIRLLNPRCNLGHEFLQQAAQQWDLLRQEAVIRSISSFSNVDGAIVIDGLPQVLAFGVICNNFNDPARHVLRSTDGSRPMIGKEVDRSEFGGSRHQSAIDFCSSHSPAGAVVASHDGGLTVFVSSEKGRVIGSRVSLIRSDAEVKNRE